MAHATVSNVRLIAAWVEGEVYSKRRQVRIVEVHNGTFGTAADSIPASALGLTKIEEATVGYDANANAALALVPNPSGSLLYVFKAVDGAANPATQVLSATPNGLYFTVKGY